MLKALPIEAQAIYTEGAIALALGIPLATLSRARREKTLRFTRKGRRVLILGQWLLDWMESDAEWQKGGEPCPA
jgi:hypothetical protein